MNAIKWLLLHLIIVAAAVIWLLFIPAIENARGTAHESIAGMRIGGEGSVRFSTVSLPAMLLYYGTLGAIAGLVMLALSSGGAVAQANKLVYAISLVSVLVMFAIFFTYSNYLENGAPSYVLGFPVPSAIAVYAVWGSGLLYSFLYVFGFDRFVYTATQKQGFEALLDDTAKKTEQP